MKPKENSWSIVVAGAWNRMIFTPDWVGKKIFGVDHMETLVPLMPRAPTVYQVPNMQLAIEDGKLAIRPRQYEVSVLEQAEATVITVLELLPHTPVSGVGVNLAFVEENPTPDLLTMFNLKDDAGFTDTWQIAAKEIRRQLAKGVDDEILNLTLSYTSERAVEFDGNFHCAAADATSAANKVKGRTKVYLETFTRLLLDVYKLK